MNTNRYPFALLLAAVLGAPASAQWIEKSTERVLPYDSTTATGDLRTRSASGDFTGDFRLDVVSVDGNDSHLDFAYDAGLMTATFSVTGDANDVATVRTAPGSPSKIVTTSASGLTLYENYSSGAFTTSSTVGTSIWDDASRVIPCLFDTNSETDFIGLSDDKKTVIVLLDGLTGSPATSSFPIPNAALDIAVVDWDGGQYEIALLFTNGVSIRRKRGTTVTNVLLTADTGSLVTFKQAGYARGRVGVVHEDTGNMYLTVFDSTTTESPVSLPDESYAAVAAELDGDGDKDLLVASRDVDECKILYNESDGVAPGTSATFTATSGEIVDFQDASSYNADQNAWPIFDDFDNDGDNDVALYVEDLDSLVIQYNEFVLQDGERPTLEDPGPGAMIIDLEASPDVAELVLDVDTPTADACVLEVWRHLPGTTTLDEERWFYEYRDIDESAERFTIDLIDTNLSYPALAAVDTVFYVVVYMVDEDVHGTAVTAETPALWAISAEDGMVTTLSQAPGAGGVIDLDGFFTSLNGEELDTGEGVILAEFAGDPDPIPRDIMPGVIPTPEPPPIPIPPKP
jgi:hypothetical protein